MNLARDPIRAWTFDVYGTLLDVHSVTAACDAVFPGRGAELSRAWRDKQLQYTWLRSLMGRYRPFDQVTAEALRAACGGLGLEVARATAAQLQDAYLRLSAFDEVPAVLAALRDRPCWVLSNGTPAMLEAALGHAGIAGHFTGLLSVEVLGVYKPDPRVYALAGERLGLRPDQIGFVSSNAWDVAGAAACGLRTFWVRRGGGVPEALDHAPDEIVHDLRGLLDG